jgi:hypothetical protein
MFAAIAPNSAQLFAESTAIKGRRSRFRHTVAGMPPGGYKQYLQQFLDSTRKLCLLLTFGANCWGLPLCNCHLHANFFISGLPMPEDG